MRKMFNVPLARKNKVREIATVNDALPPSHEYNTQQSSSKAPLLIKGLQATSSNGAASKIDGSRKAAPSAQSQLRSVRTTRARVPVHDVENVETEREVIKYSKHTGLGKPWPSQLNYGLNYGVQDGFLARRKCTINFDDLPKLDEEEFLNDSLVNFYLL
jgi:sentrin-specific protease 7